MKRILSLLLSIGILLGAAPFTAYAAHFTEHTQNAVSGEELLGAESVDLSLLGDRSQQTAASESTNAYAAALQALEDGVSKHVSSVVISEYAIPLDKFEQLFADVLYKNPRFFYLDTSAECLYYQDTSIMYSVEFTYLYSRETALDMKAQIDETVIDILSTAKTLKSNLEKVLFIHDYIVLHCAYDTTLDSNPDAVSPDAYSIYGCLVKESAVCQGYALAYKYLLNLLGIECEFLSSREMNHGWNLVMLQDSWYHVDPTWDDPVPDMLGGVKHENFLKSDAAIRENQHSGWSTENTAVSTKYDTYFWNTVDSALVTLGGNFFYMTDDKKLIKRNMQTGQTQALPCVTDDWYYWGKPFVYQGNFSRLATANGLLYYNTSKQIYSIKPDGTANTLEFQLPQNAQGYIYGVRFVDNTLAYSLKTKPVADDIIYDDTAILDHSFDTVLPPFAMGDATGDGYISLLDVLMLQRNIVKILELTQQEFTAADVNEDGLVSTRDVVQIQKKIAGMLVDFDTAA